jgi:predicted nucleic acid-binding protein
VPALLDTCVVIDFEHLADRLPTECGISAITLAELAAGAAVQSEDRDARSWRLQWARQVFEPVPFGSEAAMVYGRMIAALRQSGRSERSRVADLLIAATAGANGFELYTVNTDDFAGLDSFVDIAAV